MSVNTRIHDSGEGSKPLRSRAKSGPTPKRDTQRARRHSRLAASDRERWDAALERKRLVDSVQASRKEVLAVGERAGLSGLMKRGSNTAKEASVKDAAFHREHLARGDA